MLHLERGMRTHRRGRDRNSFRWNLVSRAAGVSRVPFACLTRAFGRLTTRLRVFFRFLYKVAASERRVVLRVIGGALFGFAALSLTARDLASDLVVRWQKFEDPVYLEVDAIAGTCNRHKGGGYFVKHGDFEASCSGANTKCGVSPTTVVYERTDPTRCRVASNAGRPSLYELHLLALTAAMVALGSGLMLVHRDASRRRRQITRACFYVGLLMWLSSMSGDLLLSDPSQREWRRLHRAQDSSADSP